MIIKEYVIASEKQVCLSVALLTDSHGLYPSDAIKYLRENKPDLIAIPGDFVSDKKEIKIDKAIKTIDECSNIATT